MSRLRVGWAFLGAAALLVTAAIAGTALGSMDIGASRVLGIVGQALGFPVEPTWRPWERTIVLNVRLPRVLVGAFVGGGLALCGAAMQAIFRNPLADPGVLGVSSGAALGAVLALFLGLAARSVWALPLFAFVGGELAASVVYGIAARRGQVPAGTLLLAGVAISAVNVALISFVISLALANWQIAGQILEWTAGKLDGRTWEHVKIVAPAMLLGAGVILAYAKDLDAMLLGEVHAASVGVDVALVRRVLIAVTSLITSAAVAVAGPIGFVGLVVPHILRLVLGPSHHRLLPASALVGAAFLIGADLVARTVIAPEEMSIGVITAILGGPFFLFLLVKQRRELAL